MTRKSKNQNSLKENRLANPLRNRMFGRIVPPSYRTKMSVCWNGTMPATTAAHDYFAVSINSLHIPFASTLAVALRTVNSVGMTGTVTEVYNTAQPAGFTQICGSSALYAKYRVYSSKITSNCYVTNGSDTLVATINTVNTGTGPNTAVWTAQGSPNCSKLQDYGLYKKPQAIVNYVTVKDLFGVDNEAVKSDDLFSSAATASPANEACWIINFQNCAITTFLGVVMWNIKVEYDCEFFFPITGNLPDTLSSSSSVSSSSKDVEVEDIIKVNSNYYSKIKN